MYVTCEYFDLVTCLLVYILVSSRRKEKEKTTQKVMI